jgi:phospholipase C
VGNVDRRTFLGMVGAPALAAALPLDLSPLDLSKALAIPANSRTGSLEDVEHVIFLMQENRSFDHYFGTLCGVRGFADPHPVRLPSGKTVWHQPNGTGELLPFRPDVADLGRTFLPDPPHGWNDGHAAWNAGRYDRWVPNKGVTTMTHHTRADLPYQFALADAFTVCDNYHCSVIGPTDPNRYHMWTGWVGNDGSGGGPVITNAEAGYDWSTYPERLQAAGISWKVYQDAGVGLDAAGFWGWTEDPYIGNYGDNSLLYFHQYQNALPGTRWRTAPGPAPRSGCSTATPTRCWPTSARTWPTAGCRRCPGSSPPRRTASTRTGRRTTAPGTSRRSSTSWPTTPRCGAGWCCS